VADRKTFVIVGAGMAGAKAAETLREEGFDGRIVMVGEEHEAPYERPPLSKGYLMGEAEREEARVHDAGYYEQHDIELMQGASVTRLRPDEHAVELADGVSLSYDRLLLATGAEPRRLPIEGADLDGVRVLRTLPHSEALRSAFEGGARTVVIGGGWIGCEVAAAGRHHGGEVTLLESAATPLYGVLGPEIGEFFAEAHRAHDVRLITEAKVEAFEGEGGRVRAVRLAGGERLECDLVVVGVGVAPRTALAEAAGLDVDDGVVVDELLRTSVPDVFAAGDVANSLRPRYGRHVRVEHWANALDQGPAAARGMLGGTEPFDALPFFFSDQYDIGMEYVGLHDPADRVIVRRKGDENQLVAIWIGQDGRVSAGMHVNDWDATELLKGLIGQSVDPGRFEDDSLPLAELVPAQPRQT
jgi:3-phenylpropionate/trans-cinnamate dioxygenase ferredoxin reductase subunit